PDLGGAGTGGNGAADMAVVGGGDEDLAVPRDLAAADLTSAPVLDLAPACVDDGDGGVTPTLWLAAPTAGGIFSARLRGGSWAGRPATGASVAGGEGTPPARP